MDIPYINYKLSKLFAGKLRLGLLPIIEDQDYMNIRIIGQEEHSYGSYINILQQKIIGEDVEFTFDIINKDREEYIQILLNTIENFKKHPRKTNKRYYQILMGIFILENNSYELNEEQIKIINEVHDQADGYEKHLQIVEDWRLRYGESK